MYPPLASFTASFIINFYVLLVSHICGFVRGFFLGKLVFVYFGEFLYLLVYFIVLQYNQDFAFVVFAVHNHAYSSFVTFFYNEVFIVFNSIIPFYWSFVELVGIFFI